MNDQKFEVRQRLKTWQRCRERGIIEASGNTYEVNLLRSAEEFAVPKRAKRGSVPRLQVVVAVVVVEGESKLFESVRGCPLSRGLM